MMMSESATKRAAYCGAYTFKPDGDNPIAEFKVKFGQRLEIGRAWAWNSGLRGDEHIETWNLLSSSHAVIVSDEIEGLLLQRVGVNVMRVNNCEIPKDDPARNAHVHRLKTGDRVALLDRDIAFIVAWCDDDENDKDANAASEERAKFAKKARVEPGCIKANLGIAPGEEPSAATSSAQKAATLISTPRSRRADPASPKPPTNLRFPPYAHPGPPPPHRPRQAGAWQDALRQYMCDRASRTEAAQRMVYYEDDAHMVVYDAFPKARRHLLLLFKAGTPLGLTKAIGELEDARIVDADDAGAASADTGGGAEGAAKRAALRAAHVLARAISDELDLAESTTHAASVAAGETPPGPRPTRSALGYHAVPSLTPLHLHIISMDLHSEALKVKKHWQSFTTPFLCRAAAVEDWLAGKRRAPHDDARRHETGPMRCHRCGVPLANMPKLKLHITRCNHEVPERFCWS